MADATAGVAAPPQADGAAPDSAVPQGLPPWRQALERIRAWSPQQKIAAGAAFAVAVALLVGVWLWSRPVEHAVLFSNLEPQDGGAIVQILQQKNVKYQLTDGGTTILVPAQMVHELRLQLATQGLPKGSTVGFELMDKQRLGITQFAEQINYQRSLEGELARSIAALSAVAQARVHLAIPKRTSFLRDKQKPTASVIVHLKPGRTLDEVQIAGIRHLVAQSVPNMDPADVSIVDQNGKLLTLPPDPHTQGLNAKQLAYREELETRYRERIEALLIPIVGKPNFRAQVSLELDFDRIERTAEYYRPNPAPEQAIRSQQIHETFGNELLPQGVPGALTNQPPVPATAPITNPDVSGLGPAQQMRRERSATINYELDRTIEHTQRAQGAVKRIAVAVVINQRREQTPQGEVVIPSESELQQLEQLIKSAVGFDAARGDTITVSGALFTTIVDEPGTTWWRKLLEDPEMVEIIRELLRFLLILIALTIIYFGVVRPLIRAILPPKEKAAAEQKEEAAATEPRVEEEPSPSPEGVLPHGESPDALLHLTSLTPADPFEEKLATLRQLTQSNPKLMANLIKEWIGVSEEKKK
ncbi:MAG: flagellar basal-body MS-ring/collar protein FliF [Hydrogenophilus sp.]|nr:flagellar basal-body MS-ring/collar protein FliF [Hydrogenophilus sp.]